MKKVNKMDKNIASEVVNKFEKAKQAIEKLEQEYKSATDLIQEEMEKTRK